MLEIAWGGKSNPQECQAMADWCSHQLWNEYGRFGNCTTMGVIRNGDLVAVMVFHNWQPDTGVIEISGAAVNKRWLNKTVLHAMFGYAFDGTGSQLVVMRVSPEDEALGRILKSYGFKGHRIPRLRGRHLDEIVYTLTDDDWKNNRFERRMNGQVIESAAAA